MMCSGMAFSICSFLFFKVLKVSKVLKVFRVLKAFWAFGTAKIIKGGASRNGLQ